jgi:hypothetical protein
MIIFCSSSVWEILKHKMNWIYILSPKSKLDILNINHIWRYY